VLAINGAAASVLLSGLPFSGPVGATRVACVRGEWIAFPNLTELAGATFDMIVAGSLLPDGDVAIIMVEAEATREVFELVQDGGTAPTEEVVAAGLEAAKPAIAAICKAQQELAAKAPKAPLDFPVFLDYEDDVLAAVAAAGEAELTKAMQIAGKQERDEAADAVKDQVKQALAEQFEGREGEVSAAFRSLTKSVVRRRIVEDGARIDGRGLEDIRQLAAEVEVLPRVHGSALFERGETQILGVTTLNMLRMEQMVDTLNPESRKRYMHHYNFPPYSTGETGRVGSPSAARSATGRSPSARSCRCCRARRRSRTPSARSARRSAPTARPRWARSCASTMSLLNAGVPLKAPVAGIAMGLVYEGGKYATLTDILGAEDAFGDMDFKVAGTPQFVTALQLDTKLDGIPSSVLAAALQQARTARLAILEVMNEAIDEPDEMAPTAPRVLTVKIPVDKIGEVIGPKGKMINQIQADTGADITVEDDGTIYIGATDGPSAEAALATINMIANPTMPKVGERFLGTVVKTAAFGAFVSLMPGKDGLVHISKLGNGKRIGKVEDVVNVGDKLQVEIQEIDQRGKISLVPVSNDAPEAAAVPAEQ
jgi:polyribonucleotide nucleotidyltransferase